MNYTELEHITKHLNFSLQNAVIEQISDGSCRLQIGMRRYTDIDSKHRTFIVIDFKASHLDIYPTQFPKKAPPVPQAFTMLLRKYLMGLSITAIRLAADDRIVFVDFGSEQETQYSLIAEFTGCAPKIFFIDAENQQILGLIGDEEERIIHTEYVRPEPNLVKMGTDRFAQLRGQEYESALDALYTGRDNREAYESEHSTQLKRLKRSISRTSRLIASLNADLDKAEAAKHEKQEADLLNAYAWQIKKGSLSVDLPDFETGSPVHILLDPSLSIRGNIDKKYNHAKRMLKALPQIEIRLLKALERRDQLDALYKRFIDASTLESIGILRSEIDTLCLPDEKMRTSAKNDRPTAQIKNAEHQPYRVFTASDGTKILVGKSASDNDELTFHNARGNDTWLHVCQVPGSHVVVKHSNPTQETLLEAALLALHYSKLAQSSSAEVHVTQVKYVRKIKGAPAGKVEIRGEKSIHIRRDEKKLAKLLATVES